MKPSLGRPYPGLFCPSSPLWLWLTSMGLEGSKLLFFLTKENKLCTQIVLHQKNNTSPLVSLTYLTIWNTHTPPEHCQWKRAWKDFKSVFKRCCKTWFWPESKLQSVSYSRMLWISSQNRVERSETLLMAGKVIISFCTSWLKSVDGV